MTERHFTIAYLMGQYQEKQLHGEALFDITFEHYIPSKLERDKAKHQYQNYLFYLTNALRSIDKIV